MAGSSDRCGRVPETVDLVLETALNEREVELQARARFGALDSYQAQLTTKYERLRHFYAPLDQDQWPEDLRARPGMIHMTVNFVQAAVDIDSRLQSVLPRLSLESDSPDPQERKRAETAEKLMVRWLELTEWDVWLNDLCKVRSQLGKSVLHPFWNSDESRPDVTVIENPAMLRIGYGSSDYRVKDWAIFEFSLSPEEAMRRFPQIDIRPKSFGKGLAVQRTSTNHTDPIDQKGPVGPSNTVVSKLMGRLTREFQDSNYEGSHVAVWDYWFRKDGQIYNAMLVEGVLATDVTPHPEMPDIPYIVVENDHVPGSPEGRSTSENIIDLQIEYNRALSHWAQLIADEIDPAWQVDRADWPAHRVPKGGQVLAAGDQNQIRPIEKAINQFPIQQLLQEMWQDFLRITGLTEIHFGQFPGAQSSGRALAVQMEAGANRIDPRRRRLYRALRELVMFWAHMAERLNPKVNITNPETGQEVNVGIGATFAGLKRWKIVAPDITPRDVAEHTMDVINKVNARLMSVLRGMEEIGIDNREDELERIRNERLDPQLFPGDVQAYISLQAAMQQMWITQQQMAQQIAALQGAGIQPDQTGLNNAAAQRQQAEPIRTEDMNAPATVAGGPPPGAPGAPVLGGELQSLVRQTPSGEVQVMSQIQRSTEL